MEFKKHSLIKKWPFLGALFSLYLLLPQPAFAVSGFIELVGNAIWSFFMIPLVWALELELELLKYVARYNNFTSENGVTLGWIALRDLSNMFFILIFLIIAFATILRISSYGYKELLKRTIIIAILINFSKTIVGFVIDIAQIVMLTFLAAINDLITGGMVVAVGLQNLTSINLASGDGMAFSDYLVSLIMGALMVGILVVVVGVIVMMLMMRIVALWVAIILAPLAFLASIFPATKSFYNTWIKQLGTNLVTGPMLIFFLWLTFNIVANGQAYTSFMNAGSQPGDGATTFLETTNLVNYIVAISLLLTGVKVAASSGAAGASFASKGMGLMQKTAGKLYRRYPKALAQRVGAKAAGLITDKDGKARLPRIPDVALTRRFGLGGKNLRWDKMPFYGGRIQRGAEGIKGRNVARIMEEKAEDEKYILPQAKVAYEKSYAEGAANKSKLGRIYSRIGSWGGDKEREAMMYQNMLARGEIDATNADKATNALRNLGDEAGMQKIQSHYWTFQDKEEAMRLLKKGGLDAVLNDVKSDNLFEDKKDENGNVVIDKETGLPVKDYDSPKEQAKYAVEAIFDPSHGDADHNSIAAKLLKNTKLDRWNITDIIEKHFPWQKYLAKINAFDVPSDGAEPDKRGILGNNLSNPAVIAAQTLAKVYPQKLADRIDDEGNIKELGIDRIVQARAFLDLKDAKIKPGQIAERLYQWHFEDNKTFARRKNVADDLDSINRNTVGSEMAPWIAKKFGVGEKEKIADWDKFDEFRRDLYHQVLGLKSWTFDPYRENQQRIDYYDSDRIFDDPNFDRKSKLSYYAMQYVLPKAMRNDLEKKKETLAKEADDIFERRREFFAKTEDPEEYERRFNRKLAELEAIDNLDVDKLSPGFNKDFGPEVAEEIKRRMMAEIVGDNRRAHNWTSKSFWTEVQDGAHGSRLMEANVGNSHEAAMLDHAIDASENQQQSQAFQVATPEQTAYLLSKLVELGKQPQKVLMENTPKMLAAEAQQKLDDIKNLQAGILADDLSVLGPDLRRLTHVLKYMAEKQNATLKDFLHSGKDGEYGDNTVLKKMVDDLNILSTNADPDKKVELDYDNNVFHYLGKSYDIDRELEENEQTYRVNARIIDEKKKQKKESDKSKSKEENK